MKNKMPKLSGNEEASIYNQMMGSVREETSKFKSIIEEINEKTFNSKDTSTKKDLQIFISESNKSKLSGLDFEVQRMQNQILKQKEMISQNNKFEEKAAKKVKVLKQKFQNSLQQYNASLSHNKILRDNIDKLRQEQKIYKNLFHDISENIENCKEKMKKMIEIGSQTSKSREFADFRIKEMESQAASEEIEYNKHLLDLKSLLKKEKKLEKDLNLASPFLKSRPSSKIMETEEDIKNRILKTSWKIAQDKANMIMSLNKLEEYDDISKRFQELAGVSNFEALLKHYEETKKHNSVLFRYVNDLNIDIENLENELKELKAKVSTYNLENQDSYNGDRARIAVAEDDTKHQEEIEVCKRIQEIYERIGGESEKNVEFMSEKEKAYEKMACIENRCHELLEIYYNFKVFNAENVKTESKLEVDIPLFQEKDAEESEVVPLSWEELMKKAEKRAKLKKYTKAA